MIILLSGLLKQHTLTCIDDSELTLSSIKPVNTAIQPSRYFPISVTIVISLFIDSAYVNHFHALIRCALTLTQF